MPKLTLTLLQALIPAAGAVLSFLLLRARRLLSHLPTAVQRLLLSADHRAEHLKIIEDLAGCANLSSADRRQPAIPFITKWLDREPIPTGVGFGVRWLAATFGEAACCSRLPARSGRGDGC
jgi:hypothetical protein